MRPRRVRGVGIAILVGLLTVAAISAEVAAEASEEPAEASEEPAEPLEESSEASEEPAEPLEESSEASEEPAEPPDDEETEFGWTIVGRDQDCPDDLSIGDPEGDAELRRHQKICIDPAIADSLELSEPLVTDGSGQLVIDSEFEFAVDTLVQGVEATFRNDTTEATIRVMPDIRLRVSWVLPDQSVVVAVPTGLSDGGTLDGGAGETTDAELDPSTETGGESSSGGQTTAQSSSTDTRSRPIEIGRRGVGKIVAVGGLDMPDLADGQLAGRFEVREILPDLLRAEQLPTGAEASEGTLVVPLGAGAEARYRLAPKAGTAPEATPIMQATELTLDGEQLSRVEYEYAVRGPSIGLQVSSDYDESAAGAVFDIVVENRGSQALPGPLIITIDSVNNTNFAGYRDVSDEWQLIDGSTILWEVGGPLRSGQSLSRSAVGALNRGEDEASATWLIQVQQRGPEGELEILAESEAQTTVPAADEQDESVGVDFDPGELVQLITFVVTLALLAIIIGAVIRRYQTRVDLGGPDGENRRQHEEDVFRSYIEGIIVLVILMAIVVLALQRGGLQAESAASLIGVIAGYVLGQRRGR